MHVCLSVGQLELFIIYTYSFIYFIFPPPFRPGRTKSQSSSLSSPKGQHSTCRPGGSLAVDRGPWLVDSLLFDSPWACFNYRPKLGTTL